MIAEVILNSNAKDLDRTFDYEIPQEMENNIKLGNRVLVPFGKRIEEGFVINFKETSEFKTKPIKSFEENKFLNEEKIELAKWMAKRYFANLSDCIKLMLPPGTTTKNFDNRVKEKVDKFVYLKYTKEEIEDLIECNVIKSDKHIRVLRFLEENPDVSISELEMYTDVSRNVYKTIEKNGYIEIKEKQVDRNPFANKNVKRSSKLTLTEEQERAFSKIATNKFDEYLLFGVTGSRKNRNIYAINRKNT